VSGGRLSAAAVEEAAAAAAGAEEEAALVEDVATVGCAPTKMVQSAPRRQRVTRRKRIFGRQKILKEAGKFQLKESQACMH
jgi:hypothetical protein